MPDISKINALAIGSVSKVDGLAKASILDIDGVTIPAGVAPPLDSISGAYAGYSLRKLRTAYTGPCIQIRRSIVPLGLASAADVNFSGDTISLDSTITPVGISSAGNLGQFLAASGYSDPDSLGSSATGFLEILYDQVEDGGTSRDISNSTGSEQAILFDGTNFATDSQGLIKIDLDSNLFDGGLSYSQTVAQPYFYFVVSEKGVDNERLLQEGAQFKLQHRSTDVRQYDGITVGTARSYSYTGTRQVFAGNWDGANSFLRVDGSQVGALDVGSASQTVIQVGHSNDAPKGFLEMILFDSTPSGTDISAMETNMNSYYTLF